MRADEDRQGRDVQALGRLVQLDPKARLDLQDLQVLLGLQVFKELPVQEPLEPEEARYLFGTTTLPIQIL